MLLGSLVRLGARMEARLGATREVIELRVSLISLSANKELANKFPVKFW
jgi:hypothetical protein